MIPLQSRAFGSSGVTLTEIGFGGAAVGNLYREMSDDGARQTIEASLAAGVRYVDTAPHYGFGLSERRLGAGISGLGDVAISTKVGRTLVPADADSGAVRHGFVNADPFEPVFDYGYDAVRRQFEQSLLRLERDVVDVVFAHDLGGVTHGADHLNRFAEFMNGGYRALEDLRSEGRLRAIGLGANEWQVCLQALGHGDFDGFLLAGRYTLLEQSALDAFLPECEARGVSIVIGGPFNSGILAVGARNGSHGRFDYAAAPTDVIARVAAIEDICLEFSADLKAAALQFVLAHPAVSSVIPGAATPEEARQAVQLVQSSVPTELWRALKDAGLLREDAPTPGAPA